MNKLIRNLIYKLRHGLTAISYIFVGIIAFAALWLLWDILVLVTPHALAFLSWFFKGFLNWLNGLWHEHPFRFWVVVAFLTLPIFASVKGIINQEEKKRKGENNEEIDK